MSGEDDKIPENWPADREGTATGDGQSSSDSHTQEGPVQPTNSEVGSNEDNEDWTKSNSSDKSAIPERNSSRKWQDSDGTAKRNEPVGGTRSQKDADKKSENMVINDVSEPENEKIENSDPLLASIVSFFVPGVGNIINGQNERGMTIFILWAVWFFGIGVVGIGIFGFFISTILAVFTLGISTLLWFVLIGIFSLLEIGFHIIAAIDAYEQSDIVEKMTVPVNEIRSN